MRVLIALLTFFTLVSLATAQGYRPKAGETVLRMDIEGKGSVFILLHTKDAPQATGQVSRLVRSRFYDGQRFHRVEKSPRPYLVQVGDPASKRGVEGAGAGGSGSTVPYENSGHSHREGAVGLAMTNNRGDSQFYIMLAPARFLDGKYTVFGQVVAGMDVVKGVERGDRIASATILTG